MNFTQVAITRQSKTFILDCYPEQLMLKEQILRTPAKEGRKWSFPRGYTVTEVIRALSDALPEPLDFGSEDVSDLFKLIESLGRFHRHTSL